MSYKIMNSLSTGYIKTTIKVDQTNARPPSTQDSTTQNSADMYICDPPAKTFKRYRQHKAASVTGYCPNPLKTEKK
jgi:hypothetical protein